MKGSQKSRRRKPSRKYVKSVSLPVYPPTQIFAPHAFQTSVQYGNDIPMIYLTREVYSRMWHFVDIAEQEVGWLGTAEQTPYGNFLIKEVFLLRQEVSSSTTEISEEGIAELSEELLQRPDGLEALNAIRFWGHSHVRMATSPSFQDEKQMQMFRENGCEWFIRGILNKFGRIEFTLFLFESNLRINDAPWAIYESIDTEMRTGIEAEFAEKVKKRAYTSPVWHNDQVGDGANFVDEFTIEDIDNHLLQEEEVQ